MPNSPIEFTTMKDVRELATKEAIADKEHVFEEVTNNDVDELEIQLRMIGILNRK